MLGEVTRGLGAAYGLQELSSSGRRGGENVVLTAAPVGWHLAATGSRIVGSTDGLHELSLRSDTEGEAKSAVAIVREKPVVGRAQMSGGSNEKSFVAGTGDLEKDLLLALEHDFPVVNAPRQVHEPVHLDQLSRD